MKENYDVVICGSGLGGLLAAVRLHDLGLAPIVIEKSSLFGGTSATSGGGIWIPNNSVGSQPDSREKALDYLACISSGDYRLDKLEAYVEAAPSVLEYMQSINIRFQSIPGFPDYYSDAPGASTGRTLFPIAMDGAELGEDFFLMREMPSVFKLFNRYALDIEQGFALSNKDFGWQWVATKTILKYWTDFSWRRQTTIDRRLTQGRALIGGLRKAMLDRNIPIRLNTRLSQVSESDGRISGVEVSSKSKTLKIGSRYGVILATGGFEQSQHMRDEFLPIQTKSTWSLTPDLANTGDGIRAGVAVGARTESKDCAWWAPSMELPSRSKPNGFDAHPMFFDYFHPHSLCVNRSGVRFVNESCPYDQFGQAMVRDQQETGANVPCWLIFDDVFRRKYPLGPILPSALMPDKSLPPHWWGSYLFRTQTITELADEIGINHDVLNATVGKFNEFSDTGEDLEFGRGRAEFDRFFGDPACAPNPCLGSVRKAPFYAVKLNLGDLGTKGGLKTDAKARVLNSDGGPIAGLYAVGNCSGSPFGDCYPGGGGTLGPAAVFAFLAAEHIAGAI